MSDTPAPPTAEALKAHGQRRVNLIWETMQAAIAAAVVGSTLFVSSKLALLVLLPLASERQLASADRAFMLISNLVSLIIGFYFGRTNHQRTGGVGNNESGR